MSEEWLPHPDHPDYWVSTMGRIYSTLRRDRMGRVQGGRMLTQTPRNRNGKVKPYLCVGMAGRVKSVHHVVLETFVGPKRPGALGRHLNDVYTDNSLGNLAWGDYQSNANDRMANNGYKKNTHCLRGHLYDADNTWLTREGSQQCKTCHRNRQREWARAKRASA